MADDLVDRILAVVQHDAAVASAAGTTPGSLTVFEARDRRRTPETPYPYAVLVEVAGRYDDFNGRGEALLDRYLDLHWLDVDSRRARELVRLSVSALRRAWEDGGLDSDEGPVKSLLPGSTRAMLDPRTGEGITPENGVIDAFVQLHLVLAATL